MDPHREPTEKKRGDVVLLISGEEQPNSKGLKAESWEEPSKYKPQSPYPEIVLKSSSSPGKPPRRSDTLVRRKAIPPSAFSKPKSRFVEQAVIVANPIHDAYPRASGTPKAPKDDDDEDEEEEEEEEVYRREQSSNDKDRRRKIRVWNLIEWSMLVLSIAGFVASLLVKILEGYVIWGLEIWRWCLVVVVVFCGRLVTNWLIHILVFAIERNFLLKKKVLYFVFKLKKSVQFFLWLFLILLSWSFVFNQGDRRSPKTEKVVFIVSRLLFSLQLGSLIWVIKTLLVKMLASSFHMNRFFDRIQESIFHQYILQTLSGPPLMELAEKIGTATHPGQMSFRSNRKDGIS
ncbi:uncharacterized protein A4U43_C06F4500 [Asparagus officinalis]|uniref:Mechanosensitive ion channel protein Msy1/2-like transmembrane domain-containing protein n=1 Tax=Asparagus officinalis TaxID=4686 RepID=A0A5P1EJI6_ASPOF|nr:uncharacterized protein A4U43_C06F4500 [Asparagus officinalis]